MSNMTDEIRLKRQRYEQKRRNKIATSFDNLRSSMRELAVKSIDSNNETLVCATEALDICTEALVESSPSDVISLFRTCFFRTHP